MKEYFLQTEDGVRVAINHFDSKQRNSVLIICPGCYMCKDARPFVAMSQEFYKYQDVITMDFRGHGKSSGFFTFTSKEYLDLKAVVEYASQKYSNISVLGFSLGAATSVIYTAIYKNIQNLILVSPPTSFSKIENRVYKKEAYLPTIKKFEFGKCPNIRPGNIFSKKIKPIEVIKDISPIPVMFIAGSKDPTIYLWHARELYYAAEDPKKLQIFLNEYHAEDIFLSGPDKFVDLCQNWIFDYCANKFG